jgi:hypothetical protein
MTETTETLLTTEDKHAILNQHIKSLEYNIYGLELDLMVENAGTPDPDRVTSINAQISTANAKRDVLVAERAEVLGL